MKVERKAGPGPATVRLAEVPSGEVFRFVTVSFPTGVFVRAAFMTPSNNIAAVRLTDGLYGQYLGATPCVLVPGRFVED